jgi:hypothetical protein
MLRFRFPASFQLRANTQFLRKNFVIFDFKIAEATAELRKWSAFWAVKTAEVEFC